ncbi:MAG: protein involved in polysaccharide export with SLBB domain [Candidatus Krumholzibacteriia bacterium]|jgi:protein involved in polysaccharide export with SLBB domain
MKTDRCSVSLASRWRPVGHLALLFMLLNPVMAFSQATASESKQLSSGDAIRISVPGHSNLNQDLTLDTSGQVKLEPVGMVGLAGMTLSEATQSLKRKLRLYYPTLDDVNIILLDTGSIRIYVIGAMSDRGVLNFNSEPTVWDVMREIGGPSEGANLNAARIIRDEDGIPTVYPIDLSGVMSGENVPLFLMKNGDTLIIPLAKEGIPDVASADGVKVFGGVGVPTIVPIKEGTPLIDVLMLAGSPTPSANREKIYWIHNDGTRNNSTIVNLQAYLLTGDEAGNPLVYPGDTIAVEFKNDSWARQNLPFILGSLAAIATIYLAYYNVTRDD